MHVHTDIIYNFRKQKWCVYKYQFYFTPSKKYFSNPFNHFERDNPIQFETAELNMEFDDIETAKVWFQLDINKYWEIFMDKCFKV